MLQVCLFGTVQIAHVALSSETKISGTAQKLLAYLLLQRHRHHPREVLASLFWGDHNEERARSCLSTALWRLRSTLEPKDSSGSLYFITTPTGEIGFNRESDYWLDVATFEEVANRVLAEPIEVVTEHTVEALKNVLPLYRGELLEGYYDDWALRERERFRSLYLNSSAYLMHYYKYHQAYAESLKWGQKILREDPLYEEVHREVMWLFVANGQRARAVRQYELCCEILEAELGIPPMEETQALYAQLLQAAPKHQSEAITCQGAGFQKVLQQLQLALQDFDKSRDKLQQAIQLAEEFNKHR